MTVLEKIKRCVSLVWDFQEFYGEEDIEDFCDKELSTYTQHNEIVEYFKHLAELEKENADLKRDKEDLIFIRNQNAKCMCEDKERLTKAKELLKQFLDAKNGEDTYKAEWEAEQFLSEVEK